MKEDSLSFEGLLDQLQSVELTTVVGRITSVVGMLIKAVVPHVKIGEVCMIKREGDEPLMAEVIGFSQDQVFLSPLGEMTGIGPLSEVIPMKMALHIRVGPSLLGRVLNGLGEPLDVDVKGALQTEDTYAVLRSPPDPLKRQRITRPISTGVRAIDAMLTCGEGQRIGIFAGAGVGKSTLLGMIARNSSADVIVVVLIGERGREVREFIEQDLGEEGMSRSVVIVSTSDQPSQLRLSAAYVGTAIAEYFREQGKRVVIMMDSVTRFARALREVGLAAGEPPARAGYTPSVFATLPRLLERSGNSEVGSMTAFYTILVAGDDINEPVADETRSILDGHIVLSQALAHAYHYPAIDILQSISRVMPQLITKEHRLAAKKAREILALYRKNELLIKIGEYKRGSDKEVDYAIDTIERLNRFLKQDIDDKSTFDKAVSELRALVKVG